MSESKPKILIAEDDKPMARALELKLNHSGFQVTIAKNGQEALNILQEDKFDLVLLDLIMPQTDGFSVLKTLKEKHNDIPVIISSNLSQEGDITKAKELGAVDFIVKSNSSLKEIIELIKKYL